jgi:hypothetical protein
MRHILQLVAASVARCNNEVYLCAYVGDWGWFHEAPLSPARHLPRRHFDQLNVSRLDSVRQGRFVEHCQGVLSDVTLDVDHPHLLLVQSEHL